MNNLNPLPDAAECLALGHELLALSQRGRETAARQMAKAGQDPTWRHNRSIYDGAAGVHRPEASTRIEQFGLGLDGGRAPRNSMQAEMSESGQPLGNIGQPFSLLTRSQIESLRRTARTAKGRKRMQNLVWWLQEAAG